MKCEIHEICGDWALEIFQYPAPRKPTIVFFNSRQNALNVKRILEVDDSIPNAATVCDMQEVKHGEWQKHYKSGTTVSDGFVSSCCDMWNERKTPYCPNCGAKMDVERKDKE